MHGIVRCLRLVGALSLLLAPQSRADHFTFRRNGAAAQEQGIVLCHGMELFVITSRAGGYTPSRRAEIIAGRLEALAQEHRSEPGMFSVGFRNGEVILQQQEHEAHTPHIIVTIDRRLAGRDGVERLAQWWLALLRDHLALADGRPPRHTQGTPVGVLFVKLYAALGSPKSPVSDSEVDRVVANLATEEREMFRRGAQVVPSAFSADTERVADTALLHGKRADPHLEESAAEQKHHVEEAHRDEASVNKISSKDQERTAQESPPTEKGASAANRYRVRLTLDPARPVADQEITCILRIYEVARDAIKTEKRIPLKGAKVRGWFAPEEQDYSEVPFVSARESEQEGVYLWHRAFSKPGAYRLTIRFDAKDDRHFTATFPIMIGESRENAIPDTPDP